MESKSERIYWIDITKGVAIILVVFGHVLKGYIDAKMYKHSLFGMDIAYDAIYTFHMPLFILISGFVFAKAYYRDGALRKDAWKSQLFNLILLYFIHCLILGLLKMAFAGFVNNKVSLETILLIPVKPIQLYWYIYILAIFYFVFSLPVFWKGNRYILLAILFIVSIGAGCFSNNIFNGYFQIRRILYYAFFFYFGILCSDGVIGEAARRKIAVFAGIPSIVVVVALISRKGHLNDSPVLNTIIGIAISLVVIEVIVLISDKIKCNWLILCGKRSLEIYLIHTYICTINRAIFKKINITNSFIGVVLNALIAITLPILMAFVLEKIGLWQIVFKPYSFIRENVNKRKLK